MIESDPTYTTPQPRHSGSQHDPPLDWMYRVDAVDEAAEVFCPIPTSEIGATVGVCKLDMIGIHDGDLDRDREELEGEQCNNLALILGAPKLLRKAIVALRMCDELVTMIEESDGANLNETTVQARASLDDLDQAIDEACDTGAL